MRREAAATIKLTKEYVRQAEFVEDFSAGFSLRRSCGILGQSHLGELLRAGIAASPRRRSHYENRTDTTYGSGEEGQVDHQEHDDGKTWQRLTVQGIIVDSQWWADTAS